jgi:hypothetical protein
MDVVFLKTLRVRSEVNNLIATPPTYLTLHNTSLNKKKVNYEILILIIIALK